MEYLRAMAAFFNKKTKKKKRGRNICFNYETFFSRGFDNDFVIFSIYV